MRQVWYAGIQVSQKMAQEAFEIAMKKDYGPMVVKRLLRLQPHQPESNAKLDLVACPVAESFELNLVTLMVRLFKGAISHKHARSVWYN